MLNEDAIPLTIVIGFAVFFISVSITTILVLRKKFLLKRIRVGLISKGGHIQRYWIKKEDIKKTIKIGNKRYEYDPVAEVTTNRTKEIYYTKDSTKPIYFTSEIQNKSKISPENLNAIIETELIAKLFKKEIASLENILLVINIVLAVILLCLMFYMMYKGVKINPSDANIELLRDVFSKVLSKGV
jgi:hypothetical protein